MSVYLPQQTCRSLEVFIPSIETVSELIFDHSFELIEGEERGILVLSIYKTFRSELVVISTFFNVTCSSSAERIKAPPVLSLFFISRLLALETFTGGVDIFLFVAELFCELSGVWIDVLGVCTDCELPLPALLPLAYKFFVAKCVYVYF